MVPWSSPGPLAQLGFPPALAPDADPVMALAHERQTLLAESLRLGDEADALLKTLPREAREIPRVQVGRLITGAGDELVFAYDEEDVRQKLDSHRRAYVAGWGADHPYVKALDCRVGYLVDELRAKQAARRAAEERCGYGALARRSDELSRQWCDIERRLMTTPAASVPGLIVQLQLLREFIDAHEIDDEQLAWLDTIMAGVWRLAGREPGTVIIQPDGAIGVYRREAVA